TNIQMHFTDMLQSLHASCVVDSLPNQDLQNIEVRMRKKATYRLRLRPDSAIRNDDRFEEAVQLVVAANRELDVARNDPRLVKLVGRVARQLQDLCDEVLDGTGQKNGSSDPDALRITAFA